jgi:hypothetical protein
VKLNLKIINHVILSSCLLLLLLSAGCAANKIIVYQEDNQAAVQAQWPDRQLKNRFARYWVLRMDMQADKAFAMEAPHVQFMVPEGRYQVYVEKIAASDLINTEILEVEKINQFLYEVKFQLHLRNPEGQTDKFFHRDRWVEVDGKWYHVLRDRFIFPELS